MRITDIDFVVPCAWEGTRDELHISDESARVEGHPGRLFSGTAGLALTVAGLAAASGWQPPNELEWRFDAPLYLGDVTETRAETEADNATAISVISGGAVVAAGKIRDGGSAPLRDDSKDGEVRDQLSRTLGAGDRDLFYWWVAQGAEVVSPPDDVLPWPILLLLTSGFVANLKQFSERDLSPILRAYRWQFRRGAQVGETIRVALQKVVRRDSSSRPGSIVWTGYLALRGAERDGLIARSEFTVLCKGSPS